MYQPIKHLALAILAVLSLQNNLACAAGPAVITETKPTPPVDRSIDRIEKLTIDVKIAELEKQLRELKGSATPIQLQGQSSGAPTIIPMIGQGALNTNAPPVNAPKPLPAEPRIQSITAIGGTTTAMASDGRPLTVGSQMSINNTVWKVTSISPYGVTFQKCVKTKCTSTTVAVGQ